MPKLSVGTVTGHRVESVPRTTAAMAAWLSKRQNVRVTRATPATVGAAHLPATVVDISIAPDAKKRRPRLPGQRLHSVSHLAEWGTNIYGIGRPEVVRPYLSDVVYEGARHLFAVAIEATGQAELEDFTRIASPLIKSATGPLTPG